MRFSVLLFFLFVGLVACDSNRVFEQNKDFNQRAWYASDTVVLEFRISDARDPYNIYYNIRNSIEYPYSRIFVNYTLADSTGQIVSEKLLGNYLFDVRTGQPFGQSGIGDIYDSRFPVLLNQSLGEGKYTMKLQQFMRTDTLQGVLAAGIRVEKVGIN